MGFLIYLEGAKNQSFDNFKTTNYEKEKKLAVITPPVFAYDFSPIRGRLLTWDCPFFLDCPEDPSR